MSQDGYYDYTPTVALARPVVVCGHPGSAYREVAYDLVALTGLPLHDLDRRIEHAAGQSLWSLARQRGLEALHALEGEHLPAVLAAAPPGIVVVGEGTLLDPEYLAQLRAVASLVFLRLSAPACYWALRRRAEARHGILGHPWLPDRLDDPEDLRPMLGLLRPALAAADLVLDIKRNGVHEAVLQIEAALPDLGNPAAAAGASPTGVIQAAGPIDSRDPANE